MTIEKRNVIEDKRTPNIKTASAEEDRLEKSAAGFNKERVTHGKRRPEAKRKG